MFLCHICLFFLTIAEFRQIQGANKWNFFPFTIVKKRRGQVTFYSFILIKMQIAKKMSRLQSRTPGMEGSMLRVERLVFSRGGEKRKGHTHKRDKEKYTDTQGVQGLVPNHGRHSGMCSWQTGAVEKEPNQGDVP
jgi:hypothetical protein